MAQKKIIKKFKETLLLIIVIVIVAFVIYNVVNLTVKPTNVFMVEEDTITSEEAAEGYILREENVIKGQNYENGLVQIKNEGEKVSKGSDVFRYYGNNEEEINSKIQEINKKLQESLEEPSKIFSSDVKSLENQIDSVLSEIKSKNNIQEIQENKKDIDTYISKKAKILGTLNNSETYINDLLEEKEKYQNELSQNSEKMIATSSGVVSYRVDGLEEILKPTEFDNITEKKLRDLNIKTGQIVSTSNKEAKVANNYYCYIATFLNSEEAANTEIGKKVTIRLSTQDEIPATIEYKRQDKDKTMLVLKIKKDIEFLINYRKISFDIIWWSNTGLKVPNSAIIYDNGLSYVVRNRMGYLDKILVKIERNNKKYSIIDDYSTEELKELGFSIDEIGNMKSITMYDEVLAYPELDELR